MTPHGLTGDTRASAVPAPGTEAPEASAPAALRCDGVHVGYGREPVLEDLHLVVAHGESVALLGPSGSGKSTLLYAIAGFLGVEAGTISVAGELVAMAGYDRPPEHRDLGVVFQHYALWPHLTARDTVAYPLRRRGVRKAEARRRAGELLERMGLAELGDRRPSQLSGGQQQRVGLARALAAEASLFLFDEPTAHLDAALRTAVQQEVTQRRLASGAAALYATHDAAEALAVADRVALLRRGRIVQVGAPAAVYEQPVDLWAAQLTGPASTLDVAVAPADARTVELHVAGVAVQPICAGPGLNQRTATALVRPGWADLGGPLPGRVSAVAYRGPHTDYRLLTDAGEIEIRHDDRPRARVGDAITWSLRRAWLLA